MATNYPNGLDNLTNPASTNELDAPSHSQQHADANDAIEALETKVGINNSANTNSLDYRVRQLETVPTYTNEMAQDASAALFTHANHVNLTATYDDVSNQVILTGVGGFEPAGAVSAHESDTTNIHGIADTSLLATKSYADNAAATAAAAIVDAAPATLDTLNELAAALGDDPNYATTISTALGDKVSKSGGDTITASSASVKGLIIQGAASQTANLQEWLLSNGLQVLRVLSGGSMLLGNQGVDSNNYLSFIKAGGATGGNAGIRFGNDVDGSNQQTLTVNTGVPHLILEHKNASGAFIIKGAASQTANLQQWQNSAGTDLIRVSSAGRLVVASDSEAASSMITTSQPAISSQVLSTTSTSADYGLTINATGSGSGTSVGLAFSAFATTGYNGVATPGGAIWFTRTGTYSVGYLSLLTRSSTGANDPLVERMRVGETGTISIAGFTSSSVGLIIKSSASQSANLQEWQNSSGTVLSKVDASGSHWIYAPPATSGTVEISSPYLYLTSNRWTGSASIGEVFGLNNFRFGGIGAANAFALHIKPSYSPNAYLSVAGDTSRSVGVNVQYPSASSGYGQFGVQIADASYKGIIVRGAASQTANLQEWQDSSGTVLSRIRSDGMIFSPKAFGTRLFAGSEPADWTTYSLYSYSSSASLITLGIQGNPSQTADLTQWKNGSGTVIAKVDATGAMFTITPADSTNSTQVATTAYVKSNINNLINSAPGALDTLNELAVALGNDANFSTTITNSLALKAPLASPTFTGIPAAPTATSGTNTTQIATTAFVKTAIDSSVQPGALYQTSAPTSPAVGQIWIDSDDDVAVFDSNIVRRQTFTATESQTTFTTTVAFVQGYEQVFMNGILLISSVDYTTPSTTSVVLTTGATAGDIIDVITVTNLNSVDVYTQSETDALLAANTSVAPLSISANTNLVAKKRYFVTSASALTLTLPASPALNDEIQIVDASGNASTYNITVARNGNKINGGTGNLIIDTNGGWYTLVYTGSTYGWKVG